MYQIQKRTSTFQHIANEKLHFVPNIHQVMMQAAVTKALEEKIFYQEEMRLFVAEQMKDVLTPEILALNGKNIRSVGGHFGMDVYNCRHAIQAMMERNAAISNFKKFNIHTGQIIKTIRLNGYKLTKIVVGLVNPDDGSFEFVGTRRGTSSKLVGTLFANNPSLVEVIESLPNPLGVKVCKSNNSTQFTIDPAESQRSMMYAR
jgi:hypothetical protein